MKTGAEAALGGSVSLERSPDAIIGASDSTGVDSQRARRRRWPVAVCIAIYAGLAVVEFGSSNGLGSGHMAGPGSADQISDVWWIAWANFALVHGHNPFYSTWQNAPIGVNVVANTSMVALGVLISPITSLFGPIVAWNVLERAALLLSATSMCLVLRRWTNWWPAAFVGGLLYGFSAYETTSDPHLNVVFVALEPIFFLLLYEILVRQRWRASRVGAMLGLLCGLQYLISSEFLVSMLLLGVIATVLYLFANRQNLGSVRPYATHAALVALCVGGVLLAVPVLYTLLGPGHLNGAPNSPTDLAQLHGDLLSAFVPGYFQRFSIHSLLASYLLAGGMYLGVPFILTVGLVTALLRRRGVVVMAGALATISFVLSLGSTLYVEGRDTHIPLPFAILAHLPLIDGLLSTRFALYTALFGAAVVAFGMDTLHTRVASAYALRNTSRRRREVIVAGMTVVIAIVVAGPLLPASAQPATPTRVPDFFNSSIVTHDVPAGGTVLAYPYPDNPAFPGAGVGFSFSSRYQGVNDALLDQAASGMRFRIIGGYAWRPQATYNTIGPSVLEPTSVKALFDFAFYGVTTRPGQARLLTSNHITSDVATFLKKYNISTVVVLPVGRDAATVTHALTATIGTPQRSGGVEVWFDVQHLLKTVTPTAFEVTWSPPTTRLVRPKAGGQIVGRQYLVATGSSDVGVRSVVFDLSGRSSVQTEICRAVHFQYGWVCAWDSTTVPNGSYTLRSMATDAVGQVRRSTGIVVQVHN